MSKTKNYDGHIYIKENLQEILNTPELNHIKSSVSVLFFPENVSLKKARNSLKTIQTILDELIKEEDESNEGYP